MRTNVVRVFLVNGTAVDIEVPDEFDCGKMGAFCKDGVALVGRDHYIPGNMVAGIIRLFAANKQETVN